MTTLYRRLSQSALTFSIGPYRGRISTTTLLLGAIFILAAALRLVALDRWSLWTDEWYTLSIARHVESFHRVGPLDQHPPFYYWLVGWLIRYGTGEAWLRLPSALAGIAAVWPAWKTGQALQDRKLGLLAAGLVAFSPLLVWYGREARMYGPAIFFWTAAIYFWVQTVRRGGWPDAVGLAAATLAALFTAYPSLALWVLEIALFPFCWLLSGRHWRHLLRWLVAQAIVVGGFYLWWPFMQRQLERSLIFNWRLPFVELSGDLGTTLAFAARAGALVLVSFVVVSAIVALWPGLWPRLLDHLRPLMKPAAWVLVAAYLVILVLGAIPRGLSIRRQLLVFLLPLILSAAWGARRLAQAAGDRSPVRRLPVALLALSMLLSLIVLGMPPYQDWRNAAAYLDANDTPRDALAIFPVWEVNAVRYYSDENPRQRQLLERLPPPRDQTLPPGRRLWVIMDRAPLSSDYTTPIWAWLENNAELLQHADFSRQITVRLYRVK